MTAATPDAHRRRRRIAIASGLVLAALLALAVLAVVRFSGVADTLERARTELDSASDAVREGRIADALDALERAEVSILEANETLRSAPDFQILSLVPVVSQNLDSLDDSVESAAVLVHGGKRILRASIPLQAEDGTLQVSLSDGSMPIEEITRARTEIHALSAQLVTPAGVPSPLLMPPIRDLHDEVRDEIAVRQDELTRLDRGLTLLEELAGADRPRRFLIAVANTAEMRGTGGMMLNYGVLEGDAGTVELTGFGRVEELVVAPAVDPEDTDLPDDYVARWDGFAVTREWRNATMSGDLTLVAPTLMAMYKRATGLPAHGVIQVDPTGLAAVLEGVGPVTVEQVGTVTAENVEALVLNEAYRLFPGVEERSDVLGDVAEAAFRRLVDGEFDSVSDLAEVIAQAVDGRHIMMYSSTPAVQNAIDSFGANGTLPDPEAVDYAHLTVQNLSGNKLDYYLDTSFSIAGVRPAGEIGSWTVDITVSNTAPIGETEPRYIFGPFDDTQTAGTYRGAVTFYLPAGSELSGFSDGPYRLPPSVQTENGRPLVGYWIDVAAGESRTVTLDLTLPPRPAGEEYELALAPSARVRPTTADVEIDLGGAQVSWAVTLDRSWVLADSEPPRRMPTG